MLDTEVAWGHAPESEDGEQQKKKQRYFYPQCCSCNSCKLNPKHSTGVDNAKDQFKASMWDCNKDKQGQDSPRPGVTHSQGDTAHYSPFAAGRKLKRRVRDGGRERVGGCALYDEGGTAQSKWRKKRQLVTTSPVQPSWLQGRIPLWLDPFWPFPQNLCTQRMLVHRLGNKWRGGGREGVTESPGHSSHLPSTPSTNFLIRTSSGAAHCTGQACSCESGRVLDHQISTARHRVTSCLPSHIFSSALQTIHLSNSRPGLCPPSPSADGSLSSSTSHHALPKQL